jgi:hypothetical protein
VWHYQQFPAKLFKFDPRLTFVLAILEIGFDNVGPDKSVIELYETQFLE